MKATTRRQAVFAALAISALTVAPSICNAAEYEFIGKWNCEVATFTFTNRTYHNGTDTMRFQAVHFGKGKDFRLDFSGGYKISLFNVTQTTMTWHSLESGDTFKCNRVK